MKMIQSSKVVGTGKWQMGEDADNTIKAKCQLESPEQPQECAPITITPTAPKELLIEDAIHQCGVGKMQKLLYLPLAISSGADAAEVMLLTFLTVVLKSEWGLTDAETESIMSSVFAGLVVGTLFLAPFADWVGRRPAFLITHTGVTLFGFLTAASPSYGWLLGFRILLGVFMGGTFVSLDALGEFLPKQSRGRGMVSSGYFGTTGVLYVALMAYLILGENKHNNTWRWFTIICGIPCFLVLIMGYFWMPESPRFLLSKGKHDKALEGLRNVARLNGKDPDEVFPTGTVLVSGEDKERHLIWEIFDRTWRKTTLLLWVGWFAIFFSYYSLLSATTNVFSSQSSDTDSSSQTSYSFDYVPIIVSAAFEYVGISIVMYTIEKFGRVPQLVISWFVGGLLFFVFMIIVHFDLAYGWQLAFAILARIFFIAGSSVIWTYTVEIFPTGVRVTAHGSCAEIGRMGGFVAPYLVDSSVSKLTMGGVVFAFSTMSALAAYHFPETRGKSMGIIMDQEETKSLGGDEHLGNSEVAASTDDEAV